VNVVPIKTRVVNPPKDNLENFLASALPKLEERSIVVISSKVVAICEGACIPHDSTTKDKLVLREADQVFLSGKGKKVKVLTLRRGLLIGSAGVDESNAGNYYIVLPRKPYASARRIWKFIRKTQKLKQAGVIIADSGSVPLHRGTVGVALSAYGFMPVKNYVGTEDIFGRTMQVSTSDLMDGIAASAVLVMGEGKETTPLAVVTGLSDINFYQKELPLYKARKATYVAPDIDMFYPLLHSKLWTKTGK
jgi:dihydrofolate synthase / folylpolyglutamate synthase